MWDDFLFCRMKSIMDFFSFCLYTLIDLNISKYSYRRDNYFLVNNGLIRKRYLNLTRNIRTVSRRKKFFRPLIMGLLFFNILITFKLKCHQMFIRHLPYRPCNPLEEFIWFYVVSFGLKLCNIKNKSCQYAS